VLKAAIFLGKNKKEERREITVVEKKIREGNETNVQRKKVSKKQE